MKVIHRGIIKFVPGKMAEGMELMKEMMAASGQTWKVYRPSIGGGDVGHTIVCETEWDSLAAVEAEWEKSQAEPEMQALMQKYDGVVEHHTVEWYMPMPMP
jgi:hypothetical protein